MQRAKRFISDYLELIIVVIMVAATAALVLVVVNKIAFLNFFYIPTLVAAYFLGRRAGMTTGALSVLLVAMYAVLFPALFSPTISDTVANIALWGSFLLLTAAVVGTLYSVKQRAVDDLRCAYEGILEILAKYIDAVDSYTQDHSVRVASLAVEIAREYGLAEHEIENVRVAALLHDVGKIDVSLDVLTKASRLTEEEWVEMKRHTENGAQLLTPIGGLLKNAVPIVLYHHERWDGTGYHGHRGDEIPLGARILAVADAYDSMVTDRPYRTGRTPWEAVVEVERHSGQQFDPAAVTAFVRVTESTTREHRPPSVALSAVREG